MRILNIQLPKVVKSLVVMTPLLLATPALKAQNYGQQQDIFCKTLDAEFLEVPDSMLLSPEVQVGNDVIYPAIVVDLSEQRLYHYDYDGYLEEVYPVATGKKSTPTKPGLRIINDIEVYPYKKAAKSTKRFKNPSDYGTHLLNLSNVDTKTGKITGSDGQFIHGTFNPASIGKHASKGCVRVHNDVIDLLANSLEKGQYVLFRE